LRNGQALGSLQQAAQLIHSPLRLLETGSTEVKILLILADQVFLFLSAISSHFPNNATKMDSLTNIPESCENAKPESEDYLCTPFSRVLTASSLHWWNRFMIF